MRRRDYELIAQALNAAKPEKPTPGATDGTWDLYWIRLETWEAGVSAVGERLQANNQAFDRALFMVNCGVELA